MTRQRDSQHLNMQRFFFLQRSWWFFCFYFLEHCHLICKLKNYCPPRSTLFGQLFHFLKSVKINLGRGGRVPPNLGKARKKGRFFLGPSSLYMTYCQWMADKLKHNNSWSCYIIIEFECWTLIAITLWICFRLNETKTAAHPIALHNSCDWLRLQSVLCDWSPVKEREVLA